MKNMNSFELLSFLEKINNTLESILSDEDSYSFDIYFVLTILTHNFKMIINPKYLLGREYNYFKKKISSYYKAGGNREILPYLTDLDSFFKKDIADTVIQSKQEFILTTIFRGYSGLPEELKYFCEIPDFYPIISEKLRNNIFMKK